jgi:hypothetical protein
VYDFYNNHDELCKSSFVFLLWPPAKYGYS